MFANTVMTLNAIFRFLGTFLLGRLNDVVEVLLVVYSASGPFVSLCEKIKEVDGV